MTARKLYIKLCDEYINKGLERVTSLQSFIYSRYEACKSIDKKALLYDAWIISENDF